MVFRRRWKAARDRDHPLHRGVRVVVAVLGPDPAGDTVALLR